ncbi:MAG TPA: AEC family transporter [Bryobacteraceae bacterium]|nr:AEC family transporter [Bryobacteraceae bacterium]
MINILAFALIPIFFGLMLGYFAGLRGFVDNRDVHSLVRFVMNFALPCSLFLGIARTDPRMLRNQGGLIVVLGVVYLALFFVTLLLERRMFGASAADSAVLALTLAFPNATAVGIPLLDALYGPSAAAASAMGIAIGAVTISPLALAILEHSTQKGHSVSHSIPQAAQILDSLWKAAKRPVVWAPVLGVLVALVRVHLPDFATRSLTVMGNATAGAALFLTGLIVSAQRFQLNGRVIAAVVAKNLLQPALCLGIAWAVGLSVVETRYAVLIAAIPCGFFGLVFGKGFNSSPLTASSSLIFSYVVGIATLAGWIVLLQRLG